jgi:positive regulator of sigma E activity
MGSAINTDSDLKRAEEVDETYPEDSPLSNEASISIVSLIVFIAIGAFVGIIVSTYIVTPQTSPQLRYASMMIGVSFALLIFAGFWRARKYVADSIEKSWLVYVFIVTCVASCEIIGIVVFSMLDIVNIWPAFALVGTYYAYWKLQDRGFM